jgi:hypothetical protein
MSSFDSLGHWSGSFCRESCSLEKKTSVEVLTLRYASYFVWLFEQLHEEVLNTIQIVCKLVLGKKINDESQHASNIDILMGTVNNWCEKEGEESTPKRRRIAWQVFSRCFKDSWDTTKNVFTSTPIKINDDTFKTVTQEPTQVAVEQNTERDAIIAMSVEQQGAGQLMLPHGIENQRNCCFFIAALQVLHGLPAFRKAIYQVSDVDVKSFQSQSEH